MADKLDLSENCISARDEVAVLTYNLHSYSGETLWKENCTEVYTLEEDSEWKIIHSHWSMTKPSID